MSLREVRTSGVEESDRLAELEAVVRKDLKGFLRVGMALKEIRERDLYRVKAVTWELYLRNEWDISRSYGDRCISAYDVCQNLAMSQVQAISTGVQALLPAPGDVLRDILDPDTADISGTELSLPSNESQARPLTLLSPAQQAAVWNRVVLETDGRPTALAVRKRVEEILEAKLDVTKAEIQATIRKDVSIPDDFSQQFGKLLEVLDLYRKSGWQGFNRTLALEYVRAVAVYLGGK